jgi:lipopolysaccharide/colanic/teichoic acid biosynthesis glycosyltransferase
VKRSFDVVVSAVLFALSLPVMACVAVAVMLALGRPVFFRQQRAGLNGQLFEILKFRTMEVGMASACVAGDEERLRPLGRCLRSSSLDELPELVNVLRGDMSLVGPRPLLPEYLPLYTQEQARRHCVRPGITGWAQVNGRNALSWEDKFKLDVWYVDNHTLWLDIKILVLTVVRVIMRTGISQPGHATMERFTGSC